jgi:hypothetical protein
VKKLAGAERRFSIAPMMESQSSRGKPLYFYRLGWRQFGAVVPYQMAPVFYLSSIVADESSD